MRTSGGETSKRLQLQSDQEELKLENAGLQAALVNALQSDQEELK